MGVHCGDLWDLLVKVQRSYTLATLYNVPGILRWGLFGSCIKGVDSLLAGHP